MAKPREQAPTFVKYDNPELLCEKRYTAKGVALPPVVDPGATATADVLNAVLPPREWEDPDGVNVWVQKVSSAPATRLDVLDLQTSLDARLAAEGAKEVGLCPVREALYAQAFDEMVRQVTVNCTERGQQLLRVRDEIRLTINSYKALYESSVAFGIRKALAAELKVQKLQQYVLDGSQQVAELQRQVGELSLKCEQVEKREADRRASNEAKHQEELQVYRRANLQLTSQLQALLGTAQK